MRRRSRSRRSSHPFPTPRRLHPRLWPWLIRRRPTPTCLQHRFIRRFVNRRLPQRRRLTHRRYRNEPRHEDGRAAQCAQSVGTTATQETLATLKQIYPEAKVHNGNRFFYADPRSYQPTIYNEDLRFMAVPLPTVCDMVSDLPEVGEGIGGLLGTEAAPLTSDASVVAAKEYPERPGLWFMNCCDDTIRTVPMLQHDVKRPNDINTEQKYHVVDDCR